MIIIIYTFEGKYYGKGFAHRDFMYAVIAAKP